MLTKSQASPEPFDEAELCRDFKASSGCGYRRSVADVRRRKNQPENPSPATPCKTPGRLRVYNDLLSASIQPQTPLNLPEARHQSRLRGSYTAPARRTPSQSTQTPTTARAQRASGRRRAPSPLGIQTPGFKGLYGGMENLDDAALIAEMSDEMVRNGTSTYRPSN